MEYSLSNSLPYDHSEVFVAVLFLFTCCCTAALAESSVGSLLKLSV